MTTRIREHGPMLLLGGAGVWVMAFLGLYGFGWSDYATEALPAQDALTSGHLWQFLTLARRRSSGAGPAPIPTT